MSPRAAWRLESIGFPPVYDYVPGKEDWIAAGLPREGHHAAVPFAGDIARPIPTCKLHEKLADVRARVPPDELGGCVVLNDTGIVMGRLLREQLESTTDAPVEKIMTSGPSTVRASEPLLELVERMGKSGVRTVLVTTPEGTLLGLFDRHEAEHLLHTDGVKATASS